MSLGCPVGPEANLLNISENDARRLIVDHPMLLPEEMAAVKGTEHRGWRSKVIDATISTDQSNMSDADALNQALDMICAAASAAIDAERCPVIVLSHANVSGSRMAVPSLLAVGAAVGATPHTQLGGRSQVRLAFDHGGGATPSRSRGRPLFYYTTCCA